MPESNDRSSRLANSGPDAIDDILNQETLALNRSLQHFRSAMHYVSASQLRTAPPFRLSFSERSTPAAGWALAAASLALTILPLAIRPRTAPAPPVSTSVSESGPATNDAALLDDIETEISRTAPRSLTPLANLEEWPAASSSSASTDRFTEKKNESRQ